jgi:hypothetical protein
MTIDRFNAAKSYLFLHLHKRQTDWKSLFGQHESIRLCLTLSHGQIDTTLGAVTPDACG